MHSQTYSFLASRCIHPDGRLVLVCSRIQGPYASCTYHLAAWFDTRSRRDIIAATILTTVALLIKPPVLVILGPWVLFELYTHRIWQTKHRKALLSFLAGAATIGTLVATWNLYTHFFIFKETGLTMLRGNYGETFKTTELWFSAQLYIETLKRIWLILTPIGAVLLAIALIPINRHPKGRMMTFLFVGYLLYFIIVAEYNLPHFYYQLPFIPIAAIFIGWLVGTGIDLMKKNEAAAVAVPLTIIIAFSGIGWLSFTTSNSWYNIDHAPFILEAAAKTKEIIGPKARIMANNLIAHEFHYYADAYRPFTKYFEEADEFRSYAAQYDTVSGNFEGRPQPVAAQEFGVEYVVWLKFQEWDRVTKQLPEGTELVADEQTFTIWKLPAKN